MKFENIHSVYFIGIGGIGMSALARWFKYNGYFVAGYDRTETQLTKSLVAEGIDVHYRDSTDLIPSKVLLDRDGSLIVYTPAIPDNHIEYNYLYSRDYTILKRSQVLGELTKSNFTIAVAGTHGKTTTSSMVAHILKNLGKNCTAFVGGIMTNYESNVLIGKEGPDNIVVVEADEFDRSFLTLRPDIAIITAVDEDHLDIYGSADSLKDSFREFIKNIKKDGSLFIEERAANQLDLKSFKGIEIETYGIDKGQNRSEKVSTSDGSFIFNYRNNNQNIEGLELLLPGFHNVENATAALSVMCKLSLSAEEVKSAVANYRGVKRRFEYIIRNDELTFVDDYAHHPEEIKALLKSARFLFPKKKITAIFQPHLFTRTRDFADGFAESLSLADEVILLEIYPARELPIEGINSQMLLDMMSIDQKQLVAKKELVEYVISQKPELLITIGAGDIDTMVEPLKQALEA